MSVFPAAASHERLVRTAGLSLAVVVVGVIVGRVAVYDPTLILGAAQALLWLIVFVGVFRRVALAPLQSPILRTVALGGLALRVPIVLAHIAIGLWIFGGAVDFIGYFGNASAAGLGIFQGDYRRLEMGEDPDIGGWIVTVLYVPIYLVLGASLFGTFLWSAIVGFMGAYFFLRAFLLHFGSGRDAYVLALCLFIYPSVAFWSSLLGKDSWMFFFLGLTTYGLAKVVATPRLSSAWPLIVGAVFVTAIRPPIGAVLMVGIVAAALVAGRGWMAGLRGPTAVLRPILLIVVGIVIVGGAYGAVLRPLERYGVIGADSPSLVQGMMNLAVTRHVGGSIESEESGSGLQARISDPSAGAVLTFLPQALLTFYFRPHLFEAHNALALMAAADSALLMIVILLRWRRLFSAVRSIASRPLVTFALVTFALLSAGLCFESNLGTIVRHRVMPLPFLFILLAVPRGAAATDAERSA